VIWPLPTVTVLQYCTLGNGSKGRGGSSSGKVDWPPSHHQEAFRVPPGKPGAAQAPGAISTLARESEGNPAEKGRGTLQHPRGPQGRQGTPPEERAGTATSARGNTPEAGETQGDPETSSRPPNGEIPEGGRSQEKKTPPVPEALNFLDTKEDRTPG